MDSNTRENELLKQLHEVQQRLAAFLALSSDQQFETDEHFRFVSINADSGESREPWVGRTAWDEVLPAEVINGSWDEIKRRMEAHEPYRDILLRVRFPDQSVRYQLTSGTPFFDEQGKFRGYIGIATDITERKNNLARIEYLATHDELTALPNRTLFGEMLHATLENARRYQHKFALFFIDLDRFKTINDSLGHDAGDALLKEVATRLKHTLRSSDLVARMSGDEFVVLLPEIVNEKEVAAVAQKILSALIKPLYLAGQECCVTASIGICLYPSDAQTEEGMLKNADIAMYRAKENGKNNFQFYSENMKTQSLERLALETSMRRALERGEFYLHYQPKLDLKSGKINGVEALLRWQHPDLGSVAPNQFIPLAEETGLIIQMGKWVLKTACRQNMTWQRAGLPPVCLAVNLSARQFNDRALLDDIAAALAESGMPAHLLELELTESMVIQNQEYAINVLGALKKMGVKLALDDFGIGYSSLAQIKNYPFDTLKVDRSFIRNLPANTEDGAITDAIIAIGKTLSMTVVAEGVETIEQENFLREHACDQTQGFYFSRPVAPDEFADFLRAQSV
jgi:diguanylate cyclase (GGDEF)-like protein/PAS domain S-box-containing protein